MAKKRKPRKPKAAARERKVGVPAKACPDYLGPLAAAKWAELLPRLVERIGLLDLDWDMLELYCHAYQSFRDADESLKQDGPTLPPTETGYVQPHPAIKMRNTAFAELRRLGCELGLFPNARKGLNVRSGDSDPLSDFLKKRPK